MTKAQAFHTFWSQFGISAYDENTVPDDATLPYITYEYSEGMFGDSEALAASVWDRSTSWESVTAKAKTVTDRISYGGLIINSDDGAMWIKRGSPFITRMADESDKDVRRVIINTEVEFL